MYKTCFNCKYYHGCLAEREPSQYHIHDYCEIFKTILPFDMSTEINRFLDNHWKTVDKAAADRVYGIYTDLETGEAYCYLYEAVAEESWSDERFEANRKHNKELAIKTLEYMFEKDKVWDEFDETTCCKLHEYYNENEIAYFKDLLKRLKEIE